jgi:rhomboid family GlyGly-CTERM serine protease
MSVSGRGDALRGALTSLNGDGRYGVALATACAVLLAPELGGEPWRVQLRFERAAIAAGEWWRLLTAHVVHLGFGHAVLNCLGLALMWALFARDYSPRAWIAILASSVAAIDIGLWFGSSTGFWYVGSSGALHGVMAAGTLAHLRRGELEGWILATFLCAKLTYEQLWGAMPFDAGMPVVVAAHLYGAIGGLIAAAALSLKRRPL